VAKANQKGSSPKTFYWILGVVAVLGIGAIALAAMGGDSGMVTEPIELSDVGDAAALLERARGIAIGDENAPIKMLVFSDFQCPGCKHWALQVEAPLKADLVESGQVQLVYYDFPLSGHPHSFIVSRAARCANDQGKFWEYHDLAFAQQEQWSYSRTTPTDLLIEYAQTVGLDMGQFRSCLESDAHAETVTANQMLGAQLGVRGTPTVFVNGRQLQNWNDFQAAKAEIQAMTGASAGATTGT
jgi:protein-disulfide isomerase